MPKRQILAGFYCAAVCGCAHQQSLTSTSPVDHFVATPPAAKAAPAREGHEDLEQMLRGEVLHFDFDRASLTAESRGRLEKISEILRQHPDLAIRVEGNCDERGGEEFNLQLGQLRAAAARKYLVNLGVDPGRVNTLSYGKDRPVDPSHTSQAWAENRRDDIRVATR